MKTTNTDYDTYRENQLRIRREEHAEMFCRLEETRNKLSFWRVFGIGMSIAFLIMAYIATRP